MRGLFFLYASCRMSAELIYGRRSMTESQADFANFSGWIMVVIGIVEMVLVFFGIIATSMLFVAVAAFFGGLFLTTRRASRADKSDRDPS